MISLLPMTGHAPTPGSALPGPLSSEFYQALLDRQPTLVCCFAADGRVLFLNAAARRYFGASVQPGMLWDFFAQVPTGDRPQADSLWQGLSLAHPQATGEHQVLGASGERHRYRWHYTASFDDAGQPQQYHLFGDRLEEPQAQPPTTDPHPDAEPHYRRVLFASLPVCLAISDAQGRFLETNAAFEELQAHLGGGDSVGAIAQRWLLRSSNGQPLPIAEFAPLQALHEGRAVSNLEVCGGEATPAGSLWLNITAAPIPLAGYGVVITCTNITPRKRSAQALNQSQRAMQALMATIPDLMLRVRQDGTILEGHIPPSFRPALPPAKTLPGCHLRDLLPAEAAQINLQGLQQALKTQTPQVCEYELPMGGRSVRCEGRIIACGPTEVLELVRDVSERKAAEDALRDSEARFRAIFDQAAVGMALLTEDGHFFRVNQRFCDLSGYTPLELLLKTDRQLTVLPDRAADQRQQRRLLAGDSDRYALEKRYQHRNGSQVWVHVCVSRVRQQVQGSQYLLAVIQDISDRKAAELQLQRQARRERLVTAIAQRIHASLQLKDILNTAVAEIRQFLTCDRVVVCRQVNQIAEIAAAATEGACPQVAPPPPSPQALAATTAPLPSYQAIAICDVDDPTTPLPADYQQFLAQFPAQAHLVVPILLGDWERAADSTPRPRHWGWLAAQHCLVYPWLEEEVDFLTRVATQVGIAIQQSQLYHQLEEANQELQRLVSVDSLTQIANRRHFDHCLQIEWERARRHQQSLALILCDIDDFKRYNDTYGHLQGDDCLQQVAATLQKTLKRSTDLVARYGGEEFVLILPDTDLAGAIQMAEAIQAAIAAAAIPHRHSRVSPYLTLSLGLAHTVPSPTGSPETLLAEADRALYQAKAAGRDRFCY